MDDTQRSQAATITQRLLRRYDFKADDPTRCAHPVPYYGGGGGSRYYGPSYSQCNRAPMWHLTGTRDGYCGQHARKLGLLFDGKPVDGVTHRGY